jgi:prepilin-type N-terminal cleavage/methylation domain-containing protein
MDTKGTPHNPAFRVKAFTLIELTVAMLIGSIAVASALGAYLIIQRYALQLEQKNEEVSQILLFRNALEYDFSGAATIRYTDRLLRLDKPYSNPVEYRFDEFEVLRVAQSTDTFRINTEILNVIRDSINDKEVIGIDLIILSEGIDLPVNIRYKASEEDLFLKEIERTTELK